MALVLLLGLLTLSPQAVEREVSVRALALDDSGAAPATAEARVRLEAWTRRSEAALPLSPFQHAELAAARDDRDATARAYFVRAAAALAWPVAAADLVRLAGDPSPEVRGELARALGRVPTRAGGDALLALADDRDVGVAETARRALFAAELPADKDELRAHWRDLRVAALIGLPRNGLAERLALYVDAAGEPDAFERAAAQRAASTTDESFLLRAAGVVAGGAPPGAEFTAPFAAPFAATWTGAERELLLAAAARAPADGAFASALAATTEFAVQALVRARGVALAAAALTEADDEAQRVLLGLVDSGSAALGAVLATWSERLLDPARDEALTLDYLLAVELSLAHAPAAREVWARALRHEHERVRAFTFARGAFVLERMGGAEGRELAASLARIVGEEVDAQRRDALLALLPRNRSWPELRELLLGLGDSTATRSSSVLELLGAVSADEQVLHALLAWLREDLVASADEDVHERRVREARAQHALRAIARSAGEAAAEALAQGLDFAAAARADEVGKLAVALLARAPGGLERLAVHPGARATTRIAIETALALVSSEAHTAASTATLIARYESCDAELAGRILRRFAEHGGAEAAALLRTVAARRSRGREGDLRTTAIEALAARGGGEADCSFLAALAGSPLGGEDFELRCAIWRALPRTGGTCAREELAARLLALRADAGESVHAGEREVLLTAYAREVVSGAPPAFLAEELRRVHDLDAPRVLRARLAGESLSSVEFTRAAELGAVRELAAAEAPALASIVAGLIVPSADAHAALLLARELADVADERLRVLAVRLLELAIVGVLGQPPSDEVDRVLGEACARLARAAFEPARRTALRAALAYDVRAGRFSDRALEAIFPRAAAAESSVAEPSPRRRALAALRD